MSEVIDYQQEDRPGILYSWKEALPIKGLRVWRAKGFRRVLGN